MYCFPLSLPKIFLQGKGVLLPLALALLLAGACGRLGRVPKTVVPGEYQEITLAELRDPTAALALAGRRVRFAAFFWDHLTYYDPALFSNYALMARHPLRWRQLRWASVYESPRMQGFYDRLALDRGQMEERKPPRLAPLHIYGEVLPLGPRLTYVRVHCWEEREDP